MAHERPGKVQLGCGTLILIALIVLIFTSGAKDDLERKIDHVDTQVQELDAELSVMNNKLDVILRRLDFESTETALSN